MTIGPTTTAFHSSSVIRNSSLFFIGLISILAQVAILRELSVAFFGVELIYLLALGLWLLCTAAGALAGRIGSRSPAAAVRAGFKIAAVVLPFDLAFIRAIRVIFSDVSGAYLAFPVQVASMSLALLPVALLLGLMFRWGARAYIEDGGTLAAAYAVESAGGLAGGLLSTLFLKLGLRNVAAALICALLCVIAAQLEIRAGRTAWGRPGPVPLLLAGAAAIALWNVSRLDFFMTAWTHRNLLDTRDSPYCRITLTRAGGEISVFENDALSFNTAGTESEEFVHVAALQHPDPAAVLVLGGGVEGIVRDVLLHAPRRVDYVELNPVLLDMVRQRVSAVFGGGEDAARLAVVVEDPRAFLRNSRDAYDLILVGMAEPGSGQANRYYTREFFEECRARLSRSGVLGLRLPSSENLWTPQLAQRNSSIYRALQQVYRDVVVVPGAAGVFLSSMEPLTRDPGTLVERFEARHISARLVSPAYLRYVYTNDRFQEAARLLAAESTPINTDARPICYRYTATMWLSKFYPQLAARVPGGEGAAIPAALLAVVGAATAIALGRWRRAFGRGLLAGIAGFLGMILETVLILQYQVKSGILYRDLGVLLMSFMAGLALGAMAVDRSGLRRRAAGAALKWGLSLLGGFVLLCTVVALQIGMAGGPGLALTSIEMAAAGFLVAGVFAYASLARVKEETEVIAALYSADLIGGCVGCIAAALFMIPTLGLGATALWMIPLVLATAVLIH